MKKNYIMLVALAVLAFVGCTNDNEVVDFGTNLSTIEVDASGGVKKVKINSEDEWTASVAMNENGEPNPWITISPANGRGSVECDFHIDSALTTEPRSAVVLITNIATNKSQRVTIKQKGYDYAVSLDKTNVRVKKTAEYGKRYFDVTVKTNFPFEVEIPQGAQHWIERESPTKLGEDFQLNLNRGVRPRDVKVRFAWKINNSANVRLADIKFVPKEDILVASSQGLSVEQEAAEKIIPDTRQGDSLALLNIVNTMQCWTVWDSSTSMDTWNGVTLWEPRMEGCTPEKVGRVKRVEIFLFNSYEGLPYEIRYLTAAEEIYIFSNENSMLKNINLGEHILELQQLKRLTVGAFGISSLPENFKFANLEYLDLGSNNFQKVPDVINKENLPKLRALVLNAQQRHAISDLSNSTRDLSTVGGLIEEEKFPERLLKWGLDTLVLSVNYLHGALPSFEDDPEVPKWTKEDIDQANAIVADSLPQALIGTPKVMPHTKTFRINHNRLSGEVPRWLLMHPALDWWIPFSLVFPQEGRDADGVKAGFTNAPASLVDYYKNWYPNKKMANAVEEEVPEDENSGIINR